ncbi:MAG: glutamine amidotransferase [Vicinamibacterales bacterium]
MRFAVALPWWGYALAFGLAGALAWAAYARAAVALTASQRALLTGLRAAALLLIVAALLRPVAVVPAPEVASRVVPLLMDVSRSMGITDGAGPSRIERAREIVEEIRSSLGPAYRLDVLTFGEALSPVAGGELAATARRSDLSGAIEGVAERYRTERLAGIVVVSDGGDTSGRPPDPGRLPAARVFPVGVGSPVPPRDREVLNVTAGEPVLPEASIDLSVSAVSHGYGVEPIELRVSANGRPVEVRRARPTSDGAPVHELFTVSPAPDQPTVYSVEIPAAAGEAAAGNNARAVLVPPQAARRRILMVEGAPGFEHTFLKRALAADRGLDVDSVVRKGQNDDGRDTFFVQAGESRAAALSSGYPQTREALFAYDAIVFGNVEADFFSREQLDMTARFVAERGGGLLVLGARSFERQGLTGTPLEPVLPVDLTDRRPAATVLDDGEGRVLNAPSLTTDGLRHPATRLAAAAEENRRLWQSLPPLASVALVGGARPGAQVLAVTASPGGEGHVLLAAQRYGQGRAMVFSGEASWRWRMMRHAADITYDTIWRQMVRWLAAPAPGPVALAPMAVTLPGTVETVNVFVRDARFTAAADADVALTVTAPDGQARTWTPVLAEPREGRYAVAARFDQPGVYRLDVEARRGSTPLGTASRYVLVGGVDRETSDPRLNEPVLQRLAAATGGRYLEPDEVGELPGLLGDAGDGRQPTEVRDLWHNAWTLIGIMGLLAAEWMLRRRVGLA